MVAALLRGAVLGAALLAAGLAGAAPAAHAPRSDLGASAAFSADGRLWAAHHSGGRVVLRHSADLGRSWSEPLPVSPEGEPVQADGEGRPKIAFGPGGEIYLSWTRPLARPYTGEIRFVRSLDGGKSFSPPLTVHADRREITHRFDALAVGGDGTVYVAWIDKRDLEAARREGRDYRGAALYAAVSRDRGASFEGDIRLADHSCECCRIALLPEAEGGIVAMWRHVFAPNIRDHALIRLAADGSASPLRRATFDDWRLDACPHHGPSLARDGAGRHHAVWFTQGEGREGVWYARLGDGGVEQERRIGGAAAAHADIAAGGSRIAVAWKEFDGRRTALRALTSDDAGGSWREHEAAVTDGPSDQPRVLLRAGRAYVFWNTRDEPLRVVPLP